MNFFLSVLQTVLVSSIVIVLVWLVSKALGKRIGYGWRKLLWLVLAVRLLVPVPIQIRSFSGNLPEVEITVQVPGSLTASPAPRPMPEVEHNTPVQGGVQVPESAPEMDIITSPDQGLPENLASPVPQSVACEEKPALSVQLSALEWMILVWAAGAAAMLAMHFVQYQRMKKIYLEDAQECDNFGILSRVRRLCREMYIRRDIPVRILNQKLSRCASPMVFGYVRTYLLLPDMGYSNDELDAICRHELVHYRQKDLWYKLLMLVVCDIYWFNPVFRLMKHMAFLDVEYVCDAKATSEMDLHAKKDYSGAILKTMSGTKSRGLAFTTQFSGSKKNIRERFENIFSSHNRKMGIAMLALVLVMLTLGTACVSLNAGEVTTEGTEPVAQATQPPLEGTEPTKSDTVVNESGKKVMTIDCDLFKGDTRSLESLNELYPDYKFIVTQKSYYGNEDSFTELPTMFLLPTWAGYIDTVVDSNGSNICRDISLAMDVRGWTELLNDNIRHLVCNGNGDNLGIPLSGYGMCLIINADLFRQAGLVDADGIPVFPTTWDEFLQSALTIKEKTGADGLCLGAGDAMGVMQYLAMLQNFNHYGEYYYPYTLPQPYSREDLMSEEAIEAMKFVYDLKWKYDVLTEQPYKEDYYTCYEALANGNAAMCIGTSDILPHLASLGMDADSIAMCAVPAMEDGVQNTLYISDIAVFSRDATEEQVDIGLCLLGMMGYGPSLESSNFNMKMEIAASAGAPVIPDIPVWKTREYEIERETIEIWTDTNLDLYQPFFDAVQGRGYLVREPHEEISTLYDQLMNVLYKVTSDPNADVEALMKQANDSWLAVVNMEE